MKKVLVALGVVLLASHAWADGIIITGNTSFDANYPAAFSGPSGSPAGFTVGGAASDPNAGLELKAKGSGVVSIPSPATVGGTLGVTGAVNTTSPLGYQILGTTNVWMSNRSFNSTSPQVASVFGPLAGASLPANAQWLAAVGAGSFQHMTADNEGAGLGEMSCQNVTTGSMMTCLGTHSIGQETTSGADTAVGNDAMRNTVGSGSVTTVGLSSHRNGSGGADTSFGLAAMQANAGSITVTGTATAGDVIHIALATTTSGLLSNLPATANYTVVAGDTPTSIATGIVNAINALPSISGGYGGVLLNAYASALSGGPATVGLDFPGTSTTGWSITATATVSGAGTEVVTTAGGYTGYNNDVSGYQAMFGTGLTTARLNSVHGPMAMPFATSAQLGVCDGAYCGYNITTDTQFDISGFNAGYSLAGGTYNNTFHGYQAGYGVTTGHDNTVLGAVNNSEQNCITTGNANLQVGAEACVPFPDRNFQMSIQNIIYGTNNSGSGATMSNGQIGFGILAPNATWTFGDAGGTSRDGTHIGVVQTTAPTVTNGTLDAHGSDVAGLVTLSAANPVVTFKVAFATAPHCTVSSPSGTAFTYAASTTALTITGGAAGNTAAYTCIQ